MKLRVALLAAVIAIPLYAQNIASFQVVAESSKVVAGMKTRARAVARDPQGTVLNLSYQWSTADSSVAKVEFDGTITGVNLGITRVRAAVNNNIFGETTIQVLPARIELSPSSTGMEVGESRQFSARVLDAAGNGLNTPLRWQVLSGQGFTSNAGSVSAGGMVTALAEGELLVRAGFLYNTYIPGLQNEAFTDAALRVVPPEHFKFARVFRTSDKAGAARTLSFRASALSGNDAGNIVFVAAFDGRANALVSWDGSKLQPLAAGGTPGILPGTSVLDFFGFATNGRGDTVATVQVAGAGSFLYASRGGGPMQPLVADNSIVGAQYEGAGALRFPRCPLASDGGVAFNANFRNPGETTQYNGLFYMDDLGFDRLVASNQEPLAGLGAVPTFDVDAFGPAPGGTVYFLASGGGRRGLFRQQGFAKPQKLLVTGDSFLNSTITAFMTANMFWSGSNGDVVFGVQLANNTNYLVRLPGGSLEGARSLRLNGWNTVYAVHPEHGVLFNGTETGQANGLNLWKDTVRQVLLTGRTPVDGSTVDVIDGAAVDAAGVVTALVRTPAAPQLLVRFAAAGPIVLLRGGDAVDISLPDNVWGFVPGGKTGGPHVLMGGASASVFELGPDGSPKSQPAFAAGELVSGQWRHTGSTTGNSRRGPDGQIYVTQTTGFGVVRKAPGGAVEPVLAGNQRLPDGALLYSAYEIRVNAKGQLLTTQGSDRGDTRLALTTDQVTRVLASTDGSTSVEGFGSLAAWGEPQLDESGRVLAYVRNTQGQFGLILWVDGTWRVIWRTGLDIGRWRVSSVANLKALGERFYFRAQVPGGSWVIAQLAGSDASVVLDFDEIAANGVSVNSVGGYDVNSRGDLLFQAFSFGLTFYGVKTASGGFRHIYTNTGLTADADLPLRLLDSELRDDGTAYLLFVGLFDEPVLYRAEPR